MRWRLLGPLANPWALHKFDQDENSKSINHKLYKDTVGSLLYLTTSRLNILSSKCICANYQANPKESYLLVVKKILGCLMGMYNVGLWYSKNSSIDLIAYF